MGSPAAFLWASVIAGGLAFGCNRGPEIEAGEPEVAETSPAHSAPSAMQAPPISPNARSPHGDPHAAPARPRAPQVDPAAPALAGLRWEVNEPLVSRAPQSPMRNAEYAIAGEAGEAVLAVFHFPGMGGSIADNLSRWQGQFRNGDAPAEAQNSEREIHGLTVHTLDVTGTFTDGMRGGPPQDDQRMLAAIVEGPEGPVFFKLVGPAATVASAEGAFEHLLATMENQ